MCMKSCGYGFRVFLLLTFGVNAMEVAVKRPKRETQKDYLSLFKVGRELMHKGDFVEAESCFKRVALQDGSIEYVREGKNISGTASQYVNPLQKYSPSGPLPQYFSAPLQYSPTRSVCLPSAPLYSPTAPAYYPRNAFISSIRNDTPGIIARQVMYLDVKSDAQLEIAVWACVMLAKLNRSSKEKLEEWLTNACAVAGKIKERNPQSRVEAEVKEIAKMLTDNSITRSADFRNDYKTIHAAAKNGYKELVMLLLELGVSPEIRSPSQRTPLHVAAAWGRKAVVELLLERGQNGAVVRDDDGKLPLYEAVKNGVTHREVAELLIKKTLYLGENLIEVSATEDKIEFLLKVFDFHKLPKDLKLMILKMSDARLDCVYRFFPDSAIQDALKKKIVQQTLSWLKYSFLEIKMNCEHLSDEMKKILDEQKISEIYEEAIRNNVNNIALTWQLKKKTPTFSLVGLK